LKVDKKAENKNSEKKVKKVWEIKKSINFALPNREIRVLKSERKSGTPLIDKRSSLRS